MTILINTWGLTPKVFTLLSGDNIAWSSLCFLNQSTHGAEWGEDERAEKTARITLFPNSPRSQASQTLFIFKVSKL